MFVSNRVVVLEKASSVLGCPLDTVEVVGDMRMMVER